MIRQRENDWDKRYRESNTPWEEESHSQDLMSALAQFSKDKVTVLEIGCGLGVNAARMAELGLEVDATDISSECIHRATKHSSRTTKGLVRFTQLDFIQDEIEKKYDIVFDKGCLHSFVTQDSYNFFAKKVSGCLNKDGLWINISGNADNRDDLTKRRELSFPRISLRQIAEAVEPHFEVLEIRRGQFGSRNNFYSWVGVFQKRSFFY